VEKTRRARGNVSLSAIVAAARECFSESGVADTRMEDVGRRAGVSRPHLYTFVPSRARLVEAAALARLSELGARLEQRARELDGDIAEAIVNQVIETTRLGRDDAEFRSLADAMPRFELNALLTSGASPLHEINSRVFGPLLARALAEGRLRSDVPVDAIVEWLQGVSALLAGRQDLNDDDLRTMARRFLVPAILA
jgi:AcrR family transcriptional regulator